MPFDSPDLNLGTLLTDVQDEKIQLPDFQREWKWDDPRIASLIATITLGYPVGIMMMLQTGGYGIDLAARPLAGVIGKAKVMPERLVLDGQQRLTSLYQALKAQRPVDTMDPRGKKIKRWYLVDIENALDGEGDREDAVLSVPEDLKLRDDFGRVITDDFSTVEAQCKAGAFPLWLSFDMPQVFAWMGIYVSQDPDRVTRWNQFYEKVLANVISYTVPVIVLDRATPKEAVCTVFEKVNTGGVALNVFELLVATYAGDRTHPNFRLNDDWRARQSRLRTKPVLRSVENTDFLQAISLVASLARRDRHVAAGGDISTAPGVTCKRKDILRLGLDEYLAYADKIESALIWAAGFLAQQHIFRAADIPYRTQLVPLAAIRAALGPDGETHAADVKLRRWYWSGVLGELYGGAIETRFARDLEQMVPWIRGDTSVDPFSVAEANFQVGRLATLRTRNSAAYKGVYALLMNEGCMDWIYHQPMNMSSFFDLAVDIHHIFPKAWCAKNNIDAGKRESIVNKTALAARTNRKIGGRSPAEYMKTVESASGISGGELDRILATHLMNPMLLRSADFDGFFADRQSRLLNLISQAMGKPVVDTDGLVPGAFEDEPDDVTDTDGDVDQSDSTPTTSGRAADGSATQSADSGDASLSDNRDQKAGHDADDDFFRGADSPPSDLNHAAGDRYDTDAAARAFHTAMLDVYRNARQQANYNPSYFIQMVDSVGGVETAHRLLRSSRPSEGFVALWERGRLDLTVEAVVLRSEFESLFDEEELSCARARLEDHGYRPDEN